MKDAMFLGKDGNICDLVVHPASDHTGLLSITRTFLAGGFISLSLTRDQAMWLASALAEATEEQPTVTVTEVTQ